MKIEIWGDSWGVPNYEKPVKGFTPEGHLEFRLKKDGHIVYNLAKNGAGNLYSINNSKVDKQLDTDCIIWFHTDIGRDIPFEVIKSKNWNSDDQIDKLSKLTYTLAKSKVKDIPLIVIEGQNYTQEPFFSNILPNAFLIPKIVNRLSGIDEIPSSQMVTHVFHDRKFIKNVNWDRNRWNNEIQLAFNMMEPRSGSPFFTDASHPNDKGHLFIYNEVVKILNTF